MSSVDQSERLDEEQRSRVAALHAARAVLASRSGVFATDSVSLVDVITAAQWILDGHDPWPPDQEPDESDVDAEVTEVNDVKPSGEPASEGVEVHR